MSIAPDETCHSAKSSASSHPSGDSVDIPIAGVGEHGENCGDWVVTGFCEHQHDNGDYCGCPHLQTHSCGSRVCPRCWTRWRAKHSEKALERLIGYDLSGWLDYRIRSRDKDAGSASEYLIDGENSNLKTYRYWHSTVSIDDDSLSFKEARTEASEKAREAGYEAFGLIPHHYRIPEEKKGLLWAMHDVSSVGGAWKALIKYHKHDWKDYVEEGLHFHVVGTVGERGTKKMKHGGEVGSERVVVEHIRQLETVGDVASTWNYIMTHATPPENRHYVTWYGGISYQKFSPDRFATSVREKLREVVGSGDGGDDDENERECMSCGSNEIRPIWEAPDFLGGLRRDDHVRHRTPLDIAIEATMGDGEPPPRRDKLIEYLELDDLQKGEQVDLNGESAYSALRWS